MANETAQAQLSILFVVQHLNVGGLENVVLNLCLGLRAHNVIPIVWVYDSISGQPNLVEVFRKSGIEVHEEFKPQGFSLGSVLQLKRFIQDRQIQIVSTHDLGPLIYVSLVKLLKLFRIKIFHTQHSFVHVRREKKLATYEKIFTRFANHLIAVSESIRDEYLQLGIPASKVQMIRNGIALSHQAPSRGEKPQLREQLIGSLADAWVGAGVRAKLQSLQSRFWIVCMARLFPRKGHAQLLELWNVLPQKVRADCAMIWVGPESQPGFYKELLSKSKPMAYSEQIIWVGPSLSPSNWYRAADLFVSASEEEGMPLAPIEALGAGLPLLLSKIEGHRFLAEHSSQYDLSRPNQGAQQLCELYDQLKSTPEAYLQTLWNETALLRKHYSSEQMTSEYVKLFLGTK